MRGAAVISTGWERTGVVLKTVEIGRRETVRVSRRVLIINLLRHDGRCSGDWGVVGTRHWRGHGWKTGRHRERVSHLVVGVRGPNWAGWERALC